MVRISFAAGTLEIREVEDPSLLPPDCVWDQRTDCHRAPAQAYAELLLALVQHKVSYQDQARRYVELDSGLLARRPPRPFQTEALAALREAGGRGVVVLPTGAGKSYVGLMAIDHYHRSSLIVVPTLDLAQQWYDLLRSSFAHQVGVVGGGEHRVAELTVTTYDSAYLHMENFGARFGLVIFDECHHLPGEAYALSARACLAPYRLGLSATPERADGRHIELDTLIGPQVYHRDVVELTGDYLAEYRTEQIAVALRPAERADYERERGVYRDFVRRMGIRMSSPEGWQDFIMLSSRSTEGRRAMKAYQRQRQLAFSAPSKLDYVDHLLRQHRGERALIFTQNNDAAYAVSRRFLIPVITHQTKVTERSAILQGFREGIFDAVATSKVLNEGVDVPDASVAIVISGSGSVREHVQRLGRILRKQGDKHAVLYELVAAGTTEVHTSSRRREHIAYR